MGYWGFVCLIFGGRDSLRVSSGYIGLFIVYCVWICVGLVDIVVFDRW